MQKKAINKDQLTWILKERWRRSILSHGDALVILMHDISQGYGCCSCEKHVLAQIWSAS
jgi:hypothetical protein